MSVRLASSCSRNGISVAATEMHLTRRDVHVVDVLDRHVGGSAEGAVEVAGTGDHGMRTDDLALGIGRDELVGLGIERRVGRRDDVLLFLVSGHPVDLVGGNAVLDTTERGLDEAILVDAGVEGERADQADVGAFGGLDRHMRCSASCERRGRPSARWCGGWSPTCGRQGRQGRARTDGACGSDRSGGLPGP